MILMLALPMLLFLFMSRSQNKKQKELEASLKLGDRVVTQSGLIGKIADINDRTAKIEIAPGVVVQMLKTAIQGPEVVPDAKPADKGDGNKDKEAAKEKK